MAVRRGFKAEANHIAREVRAELGLRYTMVVNGDKRTSLLPILANVATLSVAWEHDPRTINSGVTPLMDMAQRPVLVSL